VHSCEQLNCPPGAPVEQQQQTLPKETKQAANDQNMLGIMSDKGIRQGYKTDRY